MKTRRNDRVVARSAALAVLALCVAGCAELGIDPGVADVLLGGGSSDSGRVAAGLEEALQVATQRTVTRTARRGGFLDDPALRIRLPEKLEAPVKGLRAIGLGSAADELELTMNRAAEQAAAEAGGVFARAISSLTIRDATQILRGPDDAATSYFRTQSEDELRARFDPIVESAMSQLGVYRAYEELLSGFGAVGRMAVPELDIDRYVTDRTLDGLFLVLAGEEKRIRDDPTARTTELLQSVFGGR